MNYMHFVSCTVHTRRRRTVPFITHPMRETQCMSTVLPLFTISFIDIIILLFLYFLVMFGHGSLQYAETTSNASIIYRNFDISI